MHRNDGHVQPFDNPLHAALERKQIAGARDGAFSENADHVSALKFRPRRTDRSDHVARPRRPHRNRFREPEKPVQGFQFVVRLPHHEADEALDAGADQEPVQMRYVIRNQQRRSAERHVFLAADADVEDRVRSQPQQEANQKLGNHVEQCKSSQSASPRRKSGSACRLKRAADRADRSGSRSPAGARPC